MATNDLLEKRLALFPVTTTYSGAAGSATLRIGGCDLQALADRYGTPLYLFDGATLDAAAAAYQEALQRHYPGASGITYAGKAFMCKAIAQWAQRQGFWIDCTGAGEIGVAVAAGLPRDRILVHGVNKSKEDLEAAVAHAGTIVVDNLPELYRLAGLLRTGSTTPQLWIRVRPGLAVDTHIYRQTGQEESKFGMAPAEVVAAVQFCQTEGLHLTGLHFHQGSHFHDPAPVGPALDTVLDLLVELRGQTGWYPEILCPGGGWGVAYHEEELPHPSIDRYVEFVAQRLVAGCQARALPLPTLRLEPGRSLVAQAGVAVYRVDTVKRTGARRWLLIDGGMADNPRPALYGARYSALPVTAPDRPVAGMTWIAGPYCESGDVLIEGLVLPALEAGELLAVPVSGAYHLAMGSNYNGARKPAVLWLREGCAYTILRRETVEDLLLRETELPPDA
ncbi:MAG: diaminopimelate decarboxylase [Caldilineaceae bacterium]|nr:diaminopimelate decarboxylase [Caldilineaceae bacterium]